MKRESRKVVRNNHVGKYTYSVSQVNRSSPIDAFRNLLANFLQLCLTFFEWRYFRTLMVTGVVGLILLHYFGQNWLAILFSIIAILCFIPMMMFPLLGMEFGFAAMLIISSVQGFGMGLIVGKIPNLIGHIVTFQIDMDLLYEFFIYVPIALVASFFPLHMIIPVGIFITLLYNIGYVAYFQMTGMLNVTQVSYAVTNFIFNSLVLIYLVPLLLKLGFS